MTSATTRSVWPMTGTSGWRVWCYVSDTDLARQMGVAAITCASARLTTPALLTGPVQLRNRDGEEIQASALVSMDFSYLVRLGLRSAHDPRIQDTIKVVDQVLKVDTPSGPVYHRYNEDGYGEYRTAGRSMATASGAPGRCWWASADTWRCRAARIRFPICAPCGAAPAAAACCRSRCGMRADPELELAPGRPSGSAMPLLWSARRISEAADRARASAPDRAAAVVEQRYRGAKRGARGGWHWRDEVPVLRHESGRALLIEDRHPFTLHFGFDGWQRVDGTRGSWRSLSACGRCDCRRRSCPQAAELNFTRRYEDRWEGVDHRVSWVMPARNAALSTFG
jgi:glucoamylase